MRQFIRIPALFPILAIVAFFTLFQIPTPARAQKLSDCFDAVTNAMGTVAHAVENYGAFVGDPVCSSFLTPGPPLILFGAVAAAATAANCAGVFGGHDAAACNAAVDNILMSAIVTALVAAIDGPLGFLPDDVKDVIKQIAKDIATRPEVISEVKDILSNIPILGQVMGMLPCGCKLAAAIYQTADDVVQTAKSAAGCAEFALSCLKSPIGCLGSLFESGLDALEDVANAVGEFLENAWDSITGFFEDVGCAIASIWGGCKRRDPPPPPPTPVSVDCIGGESLSGDVVDVSGRDGYKVDTKTGRFCECPASMRWRNDNGTWSCGCPYEGQSQIGRGVCGCPPDQFVKDGACQSCGPGLHYNLATNSCDCNVEGAINYDWNGNGNPVCRCPFFHDEVNGKCELGCNPGQTKAADGTCCKASHVSGCGTCCRVFPADRQSGGCIGDKVMIGKAGQLIEGCCANGAKKMRDGSCCQGSATIFGQCCPRGFFPGPFGMSCVRVMQVNLPPNSGSPGVMPANPNATGAPKVPQVAPLNPGSRTGSPGVPTCPPGQTLVNGKCVFPGGGATTQDGSSGSPGVRRDRQDDTQARPFERGRPEERERRGGDSNTFSPGVRDGGSRDSEGSTRRDRFNDQMIMRERGGNSMRDPIR